MKNTWISLLVVLSIALQSFASVANSNESHQIDSLHIQTEHSHDSDDIELFDESSDTEPVSYTHLTLPTIYSV